MRRKAGRDNAGSQRALTPFMPVVNGDVMPDFPIKMIRKARRKTSSSLAGNTLDEFENQHGAMTQMRNLDEARASQQKLKP